jgi:hypothetical protein
VGDFDLAHGRTCRETGADEIITHRFPLDKADEANALMASGRCGKVAVCTEEN